MKKLSGPIMDRIDLHVEIRRLSEDELLSTKKSEPSENIRKRVIKARKIQHERFGKNKCNGDMNSNEVQKYCKLSNEDKLYFKNVISVMKISARGFDKILKVARTIADLDNSPLIERKHLMEAISYRTK